MKKKLAWGFLLAFLLACAPARAQQLGGGNSVLCNKTANTTAAAAGTVSIINGAAGHTYSICGWHTTSNQSTATTWQLEHGTQGGPCTTPTVDTPAFSITSNAPSADHQQFATFSLPTGAQLCLVTTGATVGIQIMIFYADNF